MSIVDKTLWRIHMQSIDTLNMLEKARQRANTQAHLVETTQREHDIAIAQSMNATAKRLRTQLKRQQMSLALTQAEIREIEQSIAKEGDLVTPKKK